MSDPSNNQLYRFVNHPLVASLLIVMTFFLVLYSIQYASLKIAAAGLATATPLILALVYADLMRQRR